MAEDESSAFSRFEVSPENARALYTAVRLRLARRFYAPHALQSRLAIIGAEHVLSLSSDDAAQQRGQRVLLYGPSGCGKTTAARALAEALDLPWGGCWDMTGLVEVGYRGTDIHSFMRQLLQRMEGDIARAEMAVLTIDELSHLAVHGSSDTVGNSVRLGLQASLLPVFSANGELRFAAESNGLHGEIVLRTRRMLIVAAGVFEGLGPRATRADLEQIGIIPELADRLGVLIQLPSPSRGVLEEIFAEHAQELRRRFALFGFELDMPRETVAWLAQSVATDSAGMGTRSGAASLEDAAQRRLAMLLDRAAAPGIRTVISPDDIALPHRNDAPPRGRRRR
jgi:ATP-dependent protease Clp ATPase subunit